MKNPLENKINISVGDLIKIVCFLAALWIGGQKIYIKLSDTNDMLKKVSKQMKDIHNAFKDAATPEKKSDWGN